MSKVAVAPNVRYGHNVRMPARGAPGRYGPNRLEEIRRDREMSMEELAVLVSPPTTGSVINKLEKGHRKLTREWMYRLARALRCDWWELDATTPRLNLAREESAVIELYRGLSEPDRRAAFRVIDAMAKSRADGGRAENE